MNATNDYTLKQIAKTLDIPEATVRYYRDALDIFIPCHGTGRTRRYPQEALDLLREAADLVRDEGLTLDQVAVRWQGEKAINATTATSATTAEQQYNNDGRSIVPVDLSEMVNVLSATWAQLAQQERNNAAELVQHEGQETREVLVEGFNRLAQAMYDADKAWEKIEELERANSDLGAQVEELQADLRREKRRRLSFQEWWGRRGRGTE